MGITTLSLNRLQPYLKSGIKMLELGAQNLYDNEHYGWIAKDYFTSLAIEHHSIDIIEHQCAVKADLRDDLKYKPIFDIVTNFGTLEHVDGSIYQPLKNIHEACKIGGIMIHENPKTGNWPGHGQHYFTKEFWLHLYYEVLDVSEEPAMGNTKDGWNVCAVLRKVSDSFISEVEFNKVYKLYVKGK